MLESVGYGIRHNIEVMKKEGASPKRILAVGGSTFNLLLMQIVSDIANIEQHSRSNRSGPVVAMLFSQALGLVASKAQPRWPNG
jgi:xylulokinase